MDSIEARFQESMAEAVTRIRNALMRDEKNIEDLSDKIRQHSGSTVERQLRALLEETIESRNQKLVQISALEADIERSKEIGTRKIKAFKRP